MSLRDYPLEKARLEVQACVSVWKGILQRRFGDRVEYAYVKGSGVKAWESPIDYVPMLSDVDIHFKLREGANEWSTEEPFDEALGIAEEYEQRFLKAVKYPLHIPRPQVIVLNSHLQDPDFIMPSKIPENDVLIGSYPAMPERSIEEVRRVDAKNLAKLRALLGALPETAMDRSGIDYLNLIRRLGYEVSPAPVRLLSLTEDPEKVWSLNRTRIHALLLEKGYKALADVYSGYYVEGWAVFKRGFSETRRIRQLLRLGYRVLRGSLTLAEEAGLLPPP